MVCPVCTVAVGFGVIGLRELGISDLITGIWFGALIVSSIAWFIDWLNRKNVHFLFRKILVILSFYALFIVPLYFWKIQGQIVMSRLLLIGVIIGTIVFISAMISDWYLRKINEEKVVIKYQKVLIPLTFLIISSIITYLLIKIYSI